MIDFGAIFRRAWEICWQNRWLFLLGILAALGSAGGGGNTSFSYSFGPGDVGPEFERQMEEFFRTLVAAWPYLLFGTIVLTLFGLLLWLLSLTARGGLIAAAAELDGEMAAGPDAALGFGAALSWENLMFCLLGVTLGTFVGVLPGIGALATISMCLPITFYLDPMAALILLAGVFYGAMYGSSTASILLNLPGSAPAAVTCLDGYPLVARGWRCFSRRSPPSWAGRSRSS